MKTTNASPRLKKVAAAFVLAILAVLGLLVPLVLAQIEFPPTGSVAFIQTSGPNTLLNIGDWYARNDQGNQPHRFLIPVPCTVDSAQDFTVELFDPETLAGAISIDEIRGGADDTTFELRAPDGTVLQTTTYTPSAATNDVWVTFATFNVGTSGCGNYELLVTTSDDDDNAWRLRLSPEDPDGVPGTGDELSLGTFESSFQHDALGCQDFYFLVPVTSSIRLNNFDMDFGNLPNVSIMYFPPGGAASIAGTPSGPTVWNNGDDSNRGGDIITDPAPGWWRAELCVDSNNQYIFEPEGLAFFFNQPPLPAMTVAKDDGKTLVRPDEVLTYSIVFTNVSNPPAAAFDVTLTDQLPTNATYVPNSCAINAPFTGSCSESGGTATFTITERVFAGDSGSVQLAVQLDPDAAGLVTNSVTLNYKDSFGSSLPPETAEDIDVIPPLDLAIKKRHSTQPPPQIGGLLNYTLAISNVGDILATGVAVTDTLPANTTFVDASNGGIHNSGLVTWDLGGLAIGDRVTRTVTVRIDDPLPPGVTSVTNQARVGDDGTNGPDRNPDDNTTSDTTDLIIPVVDPGITKVVDVSQARPGDLVNFSITIFNPAPPSNTSATGVTLTDALPLELNLVSFSVSSNPTGVANDNDATVESNTVSTIGHPSGITQTIASTITVDVGSLGLNEEVTLNLTTRVNDLASPPPLDIINVATLSFNEGNPKDADVTVNVPPPSPAPSTGDNDDNDDDDDDAQSSGSPPPPAAPAVQPTPALPVALLPETGLKASVQADGMIFGLAAFFTTAFVIALAIVRRQRLKQQADQQESKHPISRS